jgi:hypothetical protein
MLLKHWNIIQYSTNRAPDFVHQPIVGYGKNINLRDILFRAQVNYPPPPPSIKWQEVRPTVIERCLDLSDNIITQTARRRREAVWMLTIKSITPLGINHMV